jgi:hypothetical protein
MQTCGSNFFRTIDEYILNSIRGMELEKISKNRINPNGIIRLLFFIFTFMIIRVRSIHKNTG